MAKQKYYLVLTTEEWRLMIECLNKLRNRLISDGRYTDAVDEALVKVANAKIKKFKIAERGGLIMEKNITDERTGLKYELVGDYYLIAGDGEPDEKQKPIGIWGQRHLRYLKNHRKVLYTNLLTSGKLNSYLADVDKQAEDMGSRPVKQMAEREGITEQFKAENQMEWVRQMNNIRNRANETVLRELIYNA